jgi:hypothetical protein
LHVADRAGGVAKAQGTNGHGGGTARAHVRPWWLLRARDSRLEGVGERCVGRWSAAVEGVGREQPRAWSRAGGYSLRAERCGWHWGRVQVRAFALPVLGGLRRAMTRLGAAEGEDCRGAAGARWGGCVIEAPVQPTKAKGRAREILHQETRVVKSNSARTFQRVRALTSFLPSLLIALSPSSLFRSYHSACPGFEQPSFSKVQSLPTTHCVFPVRSTNVSSFAILTIA